MPESGTAPTIVIDLRRDIIRIHRTTIHAMGNPDYIMLLVNPQKRILGLLQSAETDKRAHHVPYDRLHQKNASFELYSKSLVWNLKQICPNWQAAARCRLYGEIRPDDRAALFHMIHAVQLDAGA